MATIEPRQEPHVITQTISKLSTTFTTIVTLGGGPPTDYAGGRVDADADIYGGNGDGSGLTNVELGAIIGSCIAFALILLLTWCCILQARRRIEHGSASGSDYSLTDGSSRTGSSSSGSRSGSSSSRSRSRSRSRLPRAPPPARVRGNMMNIPGGPKYPTYNAMPVRNPRSNPSVRRTG